MVLTQFHLSRHRHSCKERRKTLTKLKPEGEQIHQRKTVFNLDVLKSAQFQQVSLKTEMVCECILFIMKDLDLLRDFRSRVKVLFSVVC